MADFKRDLLFYAGINTYTGSMYNIGNITMLGNGSYLQQLEVQQLTVTGNAVIPGIQFDSLTVAGNVVSGGNFIGNGALMTGVTSTLPTQANIDIVGNVTAPGNVTAQYFIGNGSALTGLLSSLPATAKIDITGNVTAPGNVVVAGQVNVTGNVQGNYFLGNGALLSGLLTELPATANIDIVGNVTSPGDILVTGQVIASGNVQGQYFKGNGAFLTGITGVISNLPATANIDIIGNVTAPGNVIVAGQVNAVGNVQGNYLIGNGVLLSGILTQQLPAVADIDIIGNVTAPGDILVTGQVISSGNVQANYFKGNGAFLTGITGVITVLPRTANIDIIGNVTAPGNVTVAGQVNVVGNVSGRFFVGNGALLTGVTPVIPATANIDIVGNVTAPGDVLVSGQIIVAGNVSGQYLKGNGALLTGLTSGVVYNIPSRANIDIIGNVTAPGNIIVTGQVNVGGNVVAGSFLGNGSLLTGITSNILTSFTADGTTITTKNLTLIPDQYLNITAPTNTSINIATNAVNTAGNLVALSNLGFIPQEDLAGYLVVPLGYVANTQARLAIAGGKAPIGSLVTQKDTGNTYLLTASPSNNAVNWSGFNGGNFPVNTVFGRVSDVIADYGDYADNYITLSKDIGTAAAGNSVAAALASLQTNKANIIGGNIAASYFIGDGSALTGLTGVVGVLPPRANIDIIGNVTSLGNITVLGQISTIGNIKAQYFYGNGYRLTGAVIKFPAKGNFDLVGNVTALGNITVGGQVTVIGNAQASFFIGNGALLKGFVADGIPPVANVNIIGNVTSPGNIISGGQMNATGNITAEYFIGNGNPLNGIIQPGRGGVLAGNLAAVSNVRIFSKQTTFMWNSAAFGSPIVNAGGNLYDNILLATVVNGGVYESQQNGWRFTIYATSGGSQTSSLVWLPDFDFSKDFIVNFSVYSSPASAGTLWLSVGGNTNGGGFEPPPIENGAVSIRINMNYGNSGSDTWYMGTAIDTANQGHATDGWMNYSFAMKTTAGRRYSILTCETFGTVETCADITGWVPTGSYMVTGGSAGFYPQFSSYLNNISLAYL